MKPIMTGDLQRNLEFLQASYGNVQNVLRFLDTKAGVVFAIAGALLATVISSGDSLKDLEIRGWECLQLIHFSILSGIASLFFAVKAIWPAHGPSEEEAFSWLFPAMHPKCYRAKSPFTIPPFKGFSDELLLDQYRLQLGHLSRVLTKKTWSVRWSLGTLLSAVGFLVTEHLV